MKAHFLGLLALFLSACASNTKQSINDCSVVADYHLIHDKDSILVCDYTLITDTVELPISSFVNNFSIIPLDDRQEALEKPDAYVSISDNYISLSNWNTPVKLYDKNTGGYIRTIGAIGQGPQDYFSPSNVKIAETQNRISVCSNKQVKLYDLATGQYIHSVNLGYNHPQRNISHLDLNNERLIVIEAPNVAGQKINIWQQDLDANIVDSFFVDYSQKMESPELHGYFGSKDASFYIFNRMNVADTLYSYSYKDNLLTSQFTMDWKGDIPSHFLQELPRYYVCVFGDFLKWQHIVLVDKQSKKGAFVKIKIDKYGLDNVYWNEIFPTLQLIGEDSFSFLIDPLNLCDKTRNHTLTIGGKMWDETLLQDANSWLVTGKWR